MKDWLHCAVILTPGAEIIVLHVFYDACLDWVLVYIAQEHCEVGHIVNWLALETFLEQMTITSVLSIIVIYITAGNALHCVTYALFTLTYEQMKMIVHEAVGIIGTIATAGVAIIIVPDTHTVEGVDELIVIFLVFKDILMVDAAHHHMIDAGA